MELRHAEEQRQHWRSLIAQEVLADPRLLVDRAAVRRARNGRLCAGRLHWRHQALCSIPRSWSSTSGSIRPSMTAARRVERRHRRPRPQGPALPADRGGPCDFALLQNYPGQMGQETAGRRKGAINLAVAAIARKLAVAVWYLMMGRWTTLEEVDRSLSQKVGKIISQVGTDGLKKLGKTRKTFREEICQTLKTGENTCWTQTKSSCPGPATQSATPLNVGRRIWITMSLSLWSVIADKGNKNPATNPQGPLPGHSAMHGRTGARVALLQSRYLLTRPVVKLEPAP